MLFLPAVSLLHNNKTEVIPLLFIVDTLRDTKHVEITLG